MSETDPCNGVLSEGDTGFHPDGRIVTVTTTSVTTFVVVDGMYPPGATDAEIITTETANAENDPHAYLDDGQVHVVVSVARVPISTLTTKESTNA